MTVREAFERSAQMLDVVVCLLRENSDNYMDNVVREVAETWSLEGSGTPSRRTAPPSAIH